MIVFYNEAAGELLGRRFEESGPMTAAGVGQHARARSTTTASRSRSSELDLHARRCARPARALALPHPLAATATDHLIEASAMPIVATGGQRGAMVFFWPVDEAAR